MKIVKYMVTNAFGDEVEGTILEAILLVKEDHNALLYHPRSSGGFCASIEMCTLQQGSFDEEDVYVSACEDDLYGWINIESKRDLNKLIKSLSEISYKHTKRGSSISED